LEVFVDLKNVLTWFEVSLLAVEDPKIHWDQRIDSEILGYFSTAQLALEFAETKPRGDFPVVLNVSGVLSTGGTVYTIEPRLIQATSEDLRSGERLVWYPKPVTLIM